MKKYYILAVTFLCLLMGQSGYAQDYQPRFEGDLVSQITAFLFSDTVANQLHEVVIMNNSKSSSSYVSSAGINYLNWLQHSTFDLTYTSTTQSEIEYYVSVNPPPPLPDTWYLDYDGDGYYSETADYCPGSNWKNWTYGYDCDDTKPQYTTECCTKTCDSGYVLNEETCECRLLLPCFGSTSSSSGSQSSALVDEIGNILNGLGIGGDTKMAVIKLASGDLTEISGYLDNLDILSKGIALGSVAISITDYYNNPTTQNLLQVLFDSGAAVVAFSTGPAAPFVSFAASFANATGATSYVLGNLANLIDRSVDCNVGQGLRFIFEP